MLGAITFAAALIGSVLLVLTPTSTFDIIIPWLLLFASLVLAFGKRAAGWLHERVTIGPRVLVVVQGVLGVYGGYFGGGVGLMTTALYGLLAGIEPRGLFAPRTLMLAIGNAAAAYRVHRRRAGRLARLSADARRRDYRRLGGRARRQAAARRRDQSVDPVRGDRDDDRVLLARLWLIKPAGAS